VETIEKHLHDYEGQMVKMEQKAKNCEFKVNRKKMEVESVRTPAIGSAHHRSPAARPLLPRCGGGGAPWQGSCAVDPRCSTRCPGATGLEQPTCWHRLPYSDGKVANRDIRVWHGATEKWSLNDGQIQKTLQPIWDRAAI
jgi:hypothetical protein